MNKIYLYADEVSREVLLNEQQKIISIGSDLGYGNFGDIIQHRNSLDFVRKIKKFATVSVMVVDSIGFKGFPSWIRKTCGSDAVIFVADYPLIFNEDSPSLGLVGEIRNLAAVHMYGGGFLNDMWGDHILGLVEYFLRLSPQVKYFASGQQVTPPYQDKLFRHIKEFKPEIFGVRDEISMQCLQKVGFEPSFSFDDATELLIKISKQLLLKNGSGALMHLNVSNYTANVGGVDGIGNDLKLIAGKVDLSKNVTLFQAFRDIRQDVFDSREALKSLDSRFPFSDFRMIELVPYAYGAESLPDAKPVVGEFGYSCSYHVALCLQLAGIPCWLRSSNPFYDQKSQALQINQEFVSFLQEPRLADHSLNLERRAKWLNVFEKSIVDTPEIHAVSRIPQNNDGSTPWPFFFKGRPTLEERLESAEEKNKSLEDKSFNERELLRQLRIETDGYRMQLTTVGAEAHLQRKRAEDALSAQRCTAAEDQIQQILNSRSWRLTRPLRAIARFATHGYFDSHGQVGLYGLLQRIGRRLPISSAMRSRVGRLLSKIRRKKK